MHCTYTETPCNDTHMCMHACTHTHRHKHAGVRACTHIYTQVKKAKSLAAAKLSCSPSETLGCLGTTQALWASAGKSPWGRASTP